MAELAQLRSCVSNLIFYILSTKIARYLHSTFNPLFVTKDNMF